MIYWDNNATTPLLPEVYAAMEPFLKERFFNPSAGYAEARRVREAVEEARAGVAALLGASPEEIVFTSGGTEATNAAFRQMAREGKGVTEQALRLSDRRVIIPMKGRAESLNAGVAAAIVIYEMTK